MKTKIRIVYEGGKEPDVVDVDDRDLAVHQRTVDNILYMAQRCWPPVNQILIWHVISVETGARSQEPEFRIHTPEFAQT